MNPVENRTPVCVCVCIRVSAAASPVVAEIYPVNFSVTEKIQDVPGTVLS